MLTVRPATCADRGAGAAVGADLHNDRLAAPGRTRHVSVFLQTANVVDLAGCRFRGRTFRLSLPPHLFRSGFLVCLKADVGSAHGWPRGLLSPDFLCPWIVALAACDRNGALSLVMTYGTTANFGSKSMPLDSEPVIILQILHAPERIAASNDRMHSWLHFIGWFVFFFRSLQPDRAVAHGVGPAVPLSVSAFTDLHAIPSFCLLSCFLLRGHRFVSGI